MAALDLQISALGRIGARCAKSLARLDLRTVGDLLWHLPFRYEDLSHVVTLDRPSAVPVTVKVRIDLIRNRRSARSHMTLTEATVSDERGSAKVVWFRQPFIAKILQPGDRVFLTGKLENRAWGLEMVNPGYERESKDPVHAARLVPIYPSTAGVTPKQLRALLHLSLPAVSTVPDPYDESFLKTHHLLALPTALHAIHFPDSYAAAKEADRRFRFDELLTFQLKGALTRRALAERPAVVVPYAGEAIKDFVKRLPFQLTDDQKKAAWAIIEDMGEGAPMHRLIEGDVGSGKTVVAAIAMYNAALGGFRSLIMAPTEILAEQHYATISKLFKGTGFKVALRTASHKTKLDKADVVVGTHALLTADPSLADAALIVVDEQHRFGVSQRRDLLARFGKGEAVPHFLSMTATPIPRSLALALYGDLKFTAIRQMPVGRRPVTTELVIDGDRANMIAAARAELAKGHGVFVICPLIEASETTESKSVEAESERLKTEFPDTEIVALHGKMKSEAKRRAMEKFQDGSAGILVSTTVVEVGVDVPRATVMIIEGSERFGLAQLHQLRGRVGRSERPSRCFLVAEDASPSALERLEAFIKAKDCFEIAEADLKLRGQGDIFGEDQSGFGELKRFNPSDVELIEETRQAAEEIIEKDPDLTDHQQLKAKVRPEAEKVHLE
jgi:ATP-dependent DNA helicase RecG